MRSRSAKPVQVGLAGGLERRQLGERLVDVAEPGRGEIEDIIGERAFGERIASDRGATGRYCHGDAPTLADCVLVPQIFNAQRFDCRVDHVPTVMRVFDACMQLDAFRAAQPSACPDAQ